MLGFVATGKTIVFLAPENKMVERTIVFRDLERGMAKKSVVFRNSEHEIVKECISFSVGSEFHVARMRFFSQDWRREAQSVLCA